MHDPVQDFTARIIAANGIGLGSDASLPRIVGVATSPRSTQLDAFAQIVAIGTSRFDLGLERVLVLNGNNGAGFVLGTKLLGQVVGTLLVLVVATRSRLANLFAEGFVSRRADGIVVVPTGISNAFFGIHRGICRISIGRCGDIVAHSKGAGGGSRCL